MACSCRTRKAKGEPVHSIRPGDSCIFCAEKHAAEALAQLASGGLRPVFRQAVMGELELARRHSFSAYPETARLIADAESAVMSRRELAEVSALVSAALESVSGIASEKERGIDPSVQIYVPGTAPSPGPSLFMGELLLSAAWRQACECGYWKENRGFIIGDLAAAQFHLFKSDRPLSDRIRDLRHEVQTSSGPVDSGWTDLILAMDAALSPVAIDIIKKRGEDFSWYLDR